MICNLRGQVGNNHKHTKFSKEGSPRNGMPGGGRIHSHSKRREHALAWESRIQDARA